MNRRDGQHEGAAPATAAEFTTRHYTPMEVAEMWGLAPSKVREIFEDEPGVLVISAPPRPGKHQRYRTLRIPEPVLERVHRRLSKAG